MALMKLKNHNCSPMSFRAKGEESEGKANPDRDLRFLVRQGWTRNDIREVARIRGRGMSQLLKSLNLPRVALREVQRCEDSRINKT